MVKRHKVFNVIYVNIFSFCLYALKTYLPANLQRVFFLSNIQAFISLSVLIFAPIAIFFLIKCENNYQNIWNLLFFFYKFAKNRCHIDYS